jgi:hypothetical protein
MKKKDEREERKTAKHDAKPDKKIRNVSATRHRRERKRAKRIPPKDIPNRLNLSAIENLYASGLITKTVAKALGVSDRTFRRYRHAEEVMAAIVRGRKKATEKVIQSELKKALGYDYAEVTMEPVLIARQRDGEKEKALLSEELKVTKTIIKHVPADQNAIEFWLTNNDEDHWKKKFDVQSGGKPVEPLTVYLPHFNGAIQLPKQD